MTTLREKLVDINGATFIGIDTETPVKLTGGLKNPLQGHVTKLVEGSSVMVFTNQRSNAYSNMVKRRLEAEGKNAEQFILGVRAWGERIPNTPLIDHNGEIYLETIFLRAGTVKYLVDGVETAAADITGLPPRKEEAEQGGLDNKVIIRTYKVSSIKRVTIDKETYALHA